MAFNQLQFTQVLYCTFYIVLSLHYINVITLVTSNFAD